MLTLNAFTQFYDTVKNFVVEVVTTVRNFLLRFVDSDVLTIFGIFLGAIIIMILFLKFSNRD